MTRPLDEIDAVARKFKMPMTDGPHYADHVLATLIADLTHHVRTLAESVAGERQAFPGNHMGPSVDDPVPPCDAKLPKRNATLADLRVNFTPKSAELRADIETAAALEALRRENAALRDERRWHSANEVPREGTDWIIWREAKRSTIDVHAAPWPCKLFDGAEWAYLPAEREATKETRDEP